MNIFNWAQDHNIIWIENIDWWLLCKAKWLYSILHSSNGLTDKRAKNICKLMFNQICINQMHHLVRLIGFGDDGEDYYYITKDVNGKIVWETMVGSITPLKGKISNWDYWSIERSFEGWEGYPGQCPKEEKFISKYEPTEYSLKTNKLYPSE